MREDLSRLMATYTYHDTYRAAVDEDDVREMVKAKIRSWYPEWHGQAACSGMPIEDFFGNNDEDGRGTITLVQLRKAKRVCNTCPVFSECLTYALKSRERFGVWGGTSGRTRARIWSMIDNGTVTLAGVVADYACGETNTYENPWGMDKDDE